MKSKAGIKIETDEPKDEPESSSTDPPTKYESGENYELATTYKIEASDLKSSGDYTGALDKYNLAVKAAPPSALLLANRADVLYRLNRFDDAVNDCDDALSKNPDRYVAYTLEHCYLR